MKAVVRAVRQPPFYSEAEKSNPVHICRVYQPSFIRNPRHNHFRNRHPRNARQRRPYLLHNTRHQRIPTCSVRSVRRFHRRRIPPNHHPSHQRIPAHVVRSVRRFRCLRISATQSANLTTRILPRLRGLQEFQEAQRKFFWQYRTRYY